MKSIFKKAITTARMEELLAQFQITMETYDGRTPLILSQEELNQIVHYHLKHPSSIAADLLEHIMNLAAMSNNKKLLYKLSKIKNISMNEVTLVSALLCGRENLVAEMLKFPNLQVPPVVLTAAFFSTISPSMILQISQVSTDFFISLLDVIYSYQPGELRNHFYPEARNYPNSLVTALCFYTENLRYRVNCPPLSLIKELRKQNNMMITEEEKLFLKKIMGALDCLIRNPKNKFANIYFNNISAQYPQIEVQKLLIVVPEFAKKILNFSIVTNNIDRMKVTSIFCKPNSESLNLALLNNVNSDLIQTLLTYPEVQTDQNTVLCLLFSHATAEVVKAILAKGMKYNAKLAAALQYAHLSPDALIQITNHCRLRMPKLLKQLDVTMQFYQQHCPELVAMMTIPGIFASSGGEPEGIPADELDQIKNEVHLSDVIDTLRNFCKQYQGKNESDAIKKQIELVLEKNPTKPVDLIDRVFIYMLDYAVMVGDEVLYERLRNQFGVEPDEKTLKRAILCGKNTIIRKLLAEGVKVTCLAPQYALFSTVEDDVLMELFKSVDPSELFYRQAAYRSFHSSEVLQKIFQCRVFPETPERALKYVMSALAMQFADDCQPVSLLRLVELQKQNQRVSEHTRALQSITQLLLTLISKKHSMKAILFFELEIHRLYKQQGFVGLLPFDAETKQLFLEYAVVANSYASFLAMITKYDILPTVTTLNRAILCGAGTPLLNRMISYEHVAPDENTLLCVLMSHLPLIIVEKLLKKGMVVNAKAAIMMAYSQQSETVNELLASKLFTANMDVATKTGAEAREFYRTACPELTEIFNAPIVLIDEADNECEEHRVVSSAISATF